MQNSIISQLDSPQRRRDSQPPPLGYNATAHRAALLPPPPVFYPAMGQLFNHGMASTSNAMMIIDERGAMHAQIEQLRRWVIPNFRH